MSKLYVLSGPEIGRFFELREGANYLGRSPDNDIRLNDTTISRRHLKIDKRENRYFITDLGSRNGTLFCGTYLVSGVEVEIKERVPLAIGMTVIGFGEGCIDLIMPFLDSIGLTCETGDECGVFVAHKDRTNQKKLEMLYKVSHVLMEKLSTKEMLERILDHVFDLLKRIDRGAFILVDPETRDIRQIISKSSKPDDHTALMYCDDVVRRVLDTLQPMVISDVHSEKNELSDTLKMLKIQSVLCVPLIGTLQPLGVIYIDSLESPYGFRHDDVSLFMDLAQRTALSIQYSQFSSELSKIADSLSGDE